LALKKLRNGEFFTFFIKTLSLGVLILVLSLKPSGRGDFEISCFPAKQNKKLHRLFYRTFFQPYQRKKVRTQSTFNWYLTNPHLGSNKIKGCFFESYCAGAKFISK